MVFDLCGENEKVYLFTYQIFNTVELSTTNDYFGLFVSN